MNIQTITNVSDCVPLYLPHSLYLKPLAKFYISVSLPVNKLGKTISNYDIMDKLKSAIKPDNFLVLKVSKSTLEFIRFEAELDDRTKLRGVLARLDGRHIKLNGFNDPFKVRSSEPKDEFPSRHDWDSFFRDAKNMDEMKPGERPDTLHISNLPIRWFCPRHMENDQNVKPSENIFKRIFEKFGSVRCVDIPICDPYRSQMKIEITGMKTFNFDQEVMFEGYVQFSEYVGFVRAMDEFRGMKLVRKMGDKNQAVNISVTFDKTKHLSDSSVKRRTIVRDRLIAKERAKEDEEIKKKKEEEEKLEKERKKQEELKLQELEKQREREEKRKEKHLKKLQERGQLELTQKIKQEERKLLIAQRKLESIRILGAIFERLKLKEVEKKSSLKTTKDKHHNKNLSAHDLRNKLVDKYKNAHEKIFVAHKNKLKKQKEKLGQVTEKGLHIFLDGDKKRDSSPSVNTISSDDSVLSDSKIDLKRKIKKEKDLDLSDSDSENEKTKKTKMPNMNPFGALYNPEMAAEWLPMGMYPYGPLFTGIPGIRPGYFPPNMPYRNFPFRGRSRGRGRGLRNRGGQYSNSSNYPYDNEQYYKYYKKISEHRDGGGYADEHDRRSSTYSSRSRSSRSRSRSSRHSKTRRYSRRTKSKSRRSRSRSRSKSNSRTRTSRRYSRSRSKTRNKLVSTRRSRRGSSSSWSKSSRSRSKSRSWSNKNRNSKEKLALEPSKLIRSAKEIQRSVQQKLHERQQEEEQKKKSQGSTSKNDDTEPSTSKKRSQTRSPSGSIDSSKFKSPKRKKNVSDDESN